MPLTFFDDYTDDKNKCNQTLAFYVADVTFCQIHAVGELLDMAVKISTYLNNIK